MNNFYDELAESYHLIFDNWDAAIGAPAGCAGPSLTNSRQRKTDPRLHFAGLERRRLERCSPGLFFSRVAGWNGQGRRWESPFSAGARLKLDPVVSGGRALFCLLRRVGRMVAASFNMPRSRSCNSRPLWIVLSGALKRATSR